MFKLAFALSALFAVACAVPPLISGVSHTQRVDANIPLAITSGLRLHAPAVAVQAVTPVLAAPANTIVANGVVANGLIGNQIVANGLIANGLVGNRLVANGLIGNQLVANGLIGNQLVANGLVSPVATVVAGNGLGVNTLGLGSLSGLAGLINVGPVGHVVAGPTVVGKVLLK